MRIVLTDGTVSDLFGAGWFKPFILCNLHTAPTIIMALETLFFNSIRRPFVSCHMTQIGFVVD